MGGVCSMTSNVVSIASDNTGSKTFPKEYIQMIDKYLCNFRYYEASTEQHRIIASKHWVEAFKERPKTTSNDSSHCDPIGVSRITQLYHTFYSYLEQHSPELKDVFRSSTHVKSKVLVHISAGMRSMLLGDVVAEKMEPLICTHMQVGVKMEHYNAFGNALMFAMKECSGSLWTPIVEDAWRRLFTHCSVVLLVATKKKSELKAKQRQKAN